MEGTAKVAKFIGNKEISIAASSGVAISREFGRKEEKQRAEVSSIGGGFQITLNLCLTTSRLFKLTSSNGSPFLPAGSKAGNVTEMSLYIFSTKTMGSI